MIKHVVAGLQTSTVGGYIARALDSGTYGAHTDFPSHSDGIGRIVSNPKRRLNDAPSSPDAAPGYIGRALLSGHLVSHSNWPSYTDSAV